MSSKILQMIIPQVISLSFLFIALQCRQAYIDKFYPDEDIVFSSQTFLMELYLPILLVTTIFQFFVVFKIWPTYRKGQKIFGLRLLQLVLLSCLVFGFLVAFINWTKVMGIQYLIENVLSITGLAILYWTSNLFFIKLIDKRYKSK